MVKEQLKVASVSNDHLLLRWQYSFPHNQDYGRKKATEGRSKLTKENIRVCMLSYNPRRLRKVAFNVRF